MTTDLKTPARTPVFDLMVALNDQSLSLSDVIARLETRHRS